MRRNILQLLLLIALVLQGAVAVGGTYVDEEPQHHCAGHDSNGADCTCCPDGAPGDTSCTVQCSVSQAPLIIATPVRVVSYSMLIALFEDAAADRNYLPLVPPPIG